MKTDDVELGVKKHDQVGEDFLKGLGLPPEVTDYVKGHVNAKRYLTFKDPLYHNSECLYLILRELSTIMARGRVK